MQSIFSSVARLEMGVVGNKTVEAAPVS